MPIEHLRVGGLRGLGASGGDRHFFGGLNDPDRAGLRRLGENRTFHQDARQSARANQHGDDTVFHGTLPCGWT